ncbi:hypothetical protein [Comamonas odontotermitis]|uniref:hypothetical protein n=1 Tax=Comamonas odontotermitis TaxID=379895 RepID=UPI00375115CC
MDYKIASLVSFFAGAFSWEIFWKIYFYHKEKNNKAERRSLDIISADLEGIHTLVETVQLQAYKYYSSPGLSDAQLSKDIKIGVKQVGDRFSRINKLLERERHGKIDSDLMVSFRRSMTLGLDTASRPAWDLNSDCYNHIANSSSELLSACRNCQIALAHKS